MLRHFALDLTASRTAQLTGLTRKSVTVSFLRIRERIAEECERASPFSSCEVEVDESYFGARRVRGKRGRGAAGKTIVFSIFKRNGCVYTEIVADCKKATLQGIIRGRVAPEAVIHSDGRRGYDGLVDVGYAKHFRVRDFCDHLRQQIAVNGVGRLTFDPLINPEDVPSPYQFVEARWELRWPSLFGSGSITGESQ